MLEFLIRLHSVQDVQDFVSLSTAQPFRVEVSDRNYTANGKSFMEMFCLGLAGPLIVRVDCDQNELDRFRWEARQFLAD